MNVMIVNFVVMTQNKKPPLTTLWQPVLGSGKNFQNADLYFRLGELGVPQGSISN
jgi:hypothetical protein